MQMGIEPRRERPALMPTSPPCTPPQGGGVRAFTFRVTSCTRKCTSLGALSLPQAKAVGPRGEGSLGVGCFLMSEVPL